MTQEDKDLLLKDLCARLPYGVKCIEKTPIEDFKDKNLWVIDRIRADTFMFGMSNCYVCYGQYEDIDNIKPYLFPLSSMTEEQRIELYKVLGLGYESHYHLSKEWEDFNNSIDNNGLFLPASWVSDLNKMYNWLNKNHFDYQGFIPMGLALDATNKNIY